MCLDVLLLKLPSGSFFFPFRKQAAVVLTAMMTFVTLFRTSVYVGQTIQYQKHKAEEISNNLEYKSC